MTSERLLNMRIEGLYLPKKFYTPKTNFWLRPCSRNSSNNVTISNEMNIDPPNYIACYSSAALLSIYQAVTTAAPLRYRWLTVFLTILLCSPIILRSLS